MFESKSVYACANVRSTTYELMKIETYELIQFWLLNSVSMKME